MRIARKLVPLSVMAIAAIAFAASTTSAQTVAIVNEPSGAACNPCIFHATGESSISTETGVAIWRCVDEFTGTLNANGTGSINWVGRTDVAPGCNSVNCDAAAERNWPVSSTVETGPNAGTLHVRFCIRSIAGPPDLHCERPFAFLEENASNGHHYLLNASKECFPNRIVAGNWEIEGRGLEIVHL